MSIERRYPLLKHAHDAGDITTGILTVPRGGSGAATLTGYLMGNGTAAFSASATIPYSDITGTPSIPVGANPTASIGLTVVNGVALTFMRSDAAQPLDQGISPTWTGSHQWTATSPRLTFNESDAAADEKITRLFINSKTVALQFVNDAGSSSRDALAVVRGTGIAMASMSFGNATDNPTYAFLGTGLTTFSGALQVNGDHVAVNSADSYFELQESDAASNAKVWWIRAQAAQWSLQSRTDAFGAGQDFMRFSRSGTGATAMVFGNATGNPTYSFLGTGAFTVGGVLDATGLRVNSKAVLSHAGSYTSGQVTVQSGGSASGGSDGDVILIY